MEEDKPDKKLEERILLKNIAARDQQAFGRVYDRHKSKVYHYALSLLHSPQYAEEITQEVFLKLWLIEHDILQIKNLEAYIRTLARNRCYDQIRRILLEKRHSQNQIADYQETHNQTEESILLNDTKRVLEEAISSLPDQQRQVYQLCQRQGLSYQQAAEQLGLSINTVKTHMKRALSTLRKQMGGHTDLAILLILLKLW